MRSLVIWLILALVTWCIVEKALDTKRLVDEKNRLAQLAPLPERELGSWTFEALGWRLTVRETR